MNKVHILTFHRALNYGAVLQCYGLYKTISKITYCDVIDYRANCIESRYKIFNKNNSIIRFIKATISAPITKRKRKKFDNFIKENINTTEIIKDRKSLKEFNFSKFDLYCVGSDQVWNLDLINKDTSFIFDFLSNGINKFSYAASIGTNIKTEWENIYKTYLESFNAVSVREETAKTQLQQCGIKASVEIDPIFLLTKEEWSQKSRLIENESYVLVYLLQKADSFIENIITYAQEHNKKIIIISTGLKRKYNAKYICDCGPEEFLGYLKNADMIFTNSFHGIAFSILFNKQFYYQLQGNNITTNSRLYDIIKLFQLECREATYIQKEDIIDYTKINSIIDLKRNHALKYLHNQIGTVK